MGHSSFEGGACGGGGGKGQGERGRWLPTHCCHADEHTFGFLNVIQCRAINNVTFRAKFNLFLQREAH